jgi:hypothetical protein
VLILIERRIGRWPDGSARRGYPSGTVIGVGMVLWGIERAADQRLWLAYPDNLGSALVQAAGVALAVAGVLVLVRSRHRWRAWLAAGAPPGPVATPQAPDLESAAAPGPEPSL